MPKSQNSYYTSLRKEYPRTWRIWYRMNKRCEDNQKGYFEVEVCDEWSREFSQEEGFINFVDDMGPSEKDLEIDRIDPWGNYEPSNCRWVTRKVQNNNYRFHHSERGKILARAKANGLSKGTVYSRLQRGWAIEDAVSLPPSQINYKDRIC
jgi:hypothetical protein